MNDDTEKLRERIDYLEEAIGDLEDTNVEQNQRICKLEEKVKKLDIMYQILEEEISGYKAERQIKTK